MEIGIIGCGYVGKALARFWKSAGHRITASTTLSTNRIEDLNAYVDCVEVVQGDLPTFFANAFARQNVLLVSVAARNPQEYEAVYLNTAQALAQAAPKLPFLQQIIYTSSTSIYGDHQGQWVDETTLPAPANRNAHILLEAERILEQIQKKICIFRLGEIYGPGREFAERLRHLKKPLPGTGGNYTNLIHLEDIVGAIDFAMRAGLHGIYNLCNDIHILRQELYNAICEKNGFEKVIWDPAIQSMHGGNKRVSNVKLKAAGYQFQEQPLLYLI